jgi:TPR repeat protein
MNNYDKNDCDFYQIFVRLDTPDVYLAQVESIKDPLQRAFALDEIYDMAQRIHDTRDILTRAFDKARVGGDNAKCALADRLCDETIVMRSSMPLSLDQNEFNRAAEAAKTQAFEIYMELSQRNHPRATLWAAFMCVHGYGCDKDEPTARKLLDKATALGLNESDMEQVNYMREQLEDLPPPPRPPKPPAP